MFRHLHRLNGRMTPRHRLRDAMSTVKELAMRVKNDRIVGLDMLHSHESVRRCS